MGDWDQSPGGALLGAWKKLAGVTVNSAWYDSDSLERPKCLERTRKKLLDYIYRLLDNPEKSLFVWLHGMAGVGKSAVAFTIAERMRGQTVRENVPDENRLAGTFFFSRKNKDRCTTGCFFATLAYQLARNFPSIRDDVSKAICDDPTLLDSDMFGDIQMTALFLRPLRELRSRLLEGRPLVFVIDALDECEDIHETTRLISLLGQALRDPRLPVIHVLFTSRSEVHIHEAFDKEAVRPLVQKIPTDIPGEDITSLVSLDGADVDGDICIFLQHSLKELQRHHPDFLRPTEEELQRLTRRAGRRFIVATTMMNFINDNDSDPRVRLNVILNLTNQLPQGTDINKFYDCILSTCPDPERAYLYLSVIAALADPLPISQISKLLGHQDKDVKTVLMQLQSIIHIPTDSGYPVDIYHSSVRDYALTRSNCNLFEERHITPPPSPHSLLAYSSFRLMRDNLPESTNLLDALLKLKTHSRAMKSHPPQRLRHSLAFIVEPLTALGVLMTLLWLRGDHGPLLYSWLETLDGRAWLHTLAGRDWLETPGGLHWLQTQVGLDWLETPDGKDWLKPLRGGNWLQSRSGWDWLRSRSGRAWLKSQSGRAWLQSRSGSDWLRSQSMRTRMRILASQIFDFKASSANEPSPNFQRVPDGQSWLESTDGNIWLETRGGQRWLQSLDGRSWLQSTGGQDWLQTWDRQQWLQTRKGREWLETRKGREWLETQSGREWLETRSGREWLETRRGREWLETRRGREWLRTRSGREWLQTRSGREWLQTRSGREWLQTRSGREWLQTQTGGEWLQSSTGREWLQTPSGHEWLQTRNGQKFLETSSGRKFLQTPSGRAWLLSPNGREWLLTWNGREWLLTSGGRAFMQFCSRFMRGQHRQRRRQQQQLGRRRWLQTRWMREWLQTQNGQEWLQTVKGREWLQTRSAREWLKIPSAREWLETQGGSEWLQTYGREWLQTGSGRGWLQTPGGREWLQTPHMQEWLQTLIGREWLQTSSGHEWLQTSGGCEWLQTTGGREWLQIPSMREWLQTPSGREWLQTPNGREWLQTPSNTREWLQTPSALEWLQTPSALEWLQTPSGQEWLQTPSTREWLQTQSAREWLQTQSGQEWLQTPSGQEWLQTLSAKEWLQTPSTREWLQTQSGKSWLQTRGGQEWLQTQSGREWLQTPSAREWLETPSGRDWLQTTLGREWQSTPEASFWVRMEDFLGTVEAISEFIVIPELSSLPPFQIIQQFKNLPDFLMFPAFLTLTSQTPTSTLAPNLDMPIIRVINDFVSLTNEVREENQSVPDVLTYACQNWARHLSRVRDSYDNTLDDMFKEFWTHYLLSWLARQWCLRGLQSCLIVLSEGQRLANEHLRIRKPSVIDRILRRL